MAADEEVRSPVPQQSSAAPHSQVHVPVLLDRCLALLAPALEGDHPVVVDATLGLGGHTAALLAAHPGLTVVGVDRDQEALRRTAQRLRADAERVRFVHAVYDQLGELDLSGVDGVLFDLGVSSLQLDEAERGFAYSRDAPLDMRMDQSTGRTAADVLNDYSQSELARVLRVHGEERFANRIASAVVRERTRAPLTSSARLVELITAAIPAAARRVGGHPAKRTFQALRIEVNQELDALRAAIPAALEIVRPGGRVVVMSYQSLEDRLVKEAFAEVTRDRTPIGLPVELPAYRPVFRLLTRGAETASEAEVTANPRAASVRLRAVERIRGVV